EKAPPRARRGRIDALLRGVLAPYVGVAPETLRFAREAHGRPYLPMAHAPDFNLSDTVGGTLVAVCGGGRIGVDLERTDRNPPTVKLARRWFSLEEADALAALGDDIARLRFLHWWTAKEASCKATGTGIYGRLHQWQFEMGIDPVLRALPNDAGAASRWQFARLAPASDYTAVLAWRDAPVDVARGLRGFVHPS
ncbi:MAG: 4'-phosphopantetheinyl transferase family protein, partial [Arenimonas sp.]